MQVQGVLLNTFSPKLLACGEIASVSVELPDAAWMDEKFSGFFDSSSVFRFAESLGLTQDDRDKSF